MARADVDDRRFDAPKGTAPIRRPSAASGDNDRFGRFTEGVARAHGHPVASCSGSRCSSIVVDGLEHVRARARCGSTRSALGFTALTLILSLQASYAAPLILLAQNRQDDRDRVQIEQDRQRAERNLADTEYLAREVVALRLAMQGRRDEGLHPRRAARPARGARPQRRGGARACRS